MLQPLYTPDAAEAATREVNVVVVPGVGTPLPSAWSGESGEWLENLVENCGGRVQIWTYETKAEDTGSPMIQQLAREGQNLLAALDKLCSGTPKEPRKRKPLFFICHSLGGIILKLALSLTGEHVLRHLEVNEVISGIVFLGTPHLPLTVEASPNLLELILRSHRKILADRKALKADDNITLAKFCHKFELLNIQVPIVSTYEMVESRVYQGMFAMYRNPKHQIIISKDRCVVGSKEEVVLGINRHHGSMCKVEVGDDLYTKISGALQRVLRDAPSLIYEKFHTSSGDAGELRTMRSQTTEDVESRAIMIANAPQNQNPLEVSQSPMSSKIATYGSSRSHQSHEESNRVANFEIAHKDPRLPCFAMRTHKKKNDFFGRGDILELIDQNLLPENKRTAPEQSAVRSFALCGMGGIGKTQIAVEYAYSRKLKYDAILWVAADDKNIMSEEFARIAVDLGLAEQNEIKDLTTAAELVKGWLSNSVYSYDKPKTSANEASWLLIFDNVDNLDVLEEFWPMTASGAVLITSRNSLAKNQIYTANHGIDLQPFSTPEAVELMNSLTRRSHQPGQHGDDHDVTEVVNKLGCLPLLIAQMAGVMTRLGLSYSDFLMLCNESGIERVGMAESTATIPEQMYSVSFRLGLDGLSSKSLGLLYLISALDPDRIPEKILMSACSKGSLGYFPKGMEQYFKARAQLLQTSLISQNPDTCDVWVHRIVQDVVKEKMDKNLLAEVYDMAIHAVSSVWPFSILETRFFTGRYKECASLFPCAVRLKNAYPSIGDLLTFEQKVSSALLFNDTGW